MRERGLYKSVLLLFGLLLMPAVTYAAGKCERLVATGNPEYPPYLWRDPKNPQQLIGANADLLQHLAKELGVDELWLKTRIRWFLDNHTTIARLDQYLLRFSEEDIDGMPLRTKREVVCLLTQAATIHKQELLLQEDGQSSITDYFTTINPRA